MSKKIKIFLPLIALFLFVAALSLTAQAKGYTNLYPASDNASLKKLITAEPLAMRDDEDAVGITALYLVDKDALKKLEESYYVTFGALVARESDGYDLSSLKLTYDKKQGNLQVPEHAVMLTVYSTDGKQPLDGKFLTEERDAFSVTLDIEMKTVERAGDGAVHLAFILLEEKNDSAATPELFYVGRKGTSYGAVPSFEGMVQAEYNQNKGDAAAMDGYIDFLQTQIKTDVSVLQNTPVIISKDGEMASTLEKGERAIWVEYVPEKDPYADSRDPMKRCVRAAYIYYPVDFDPALEAPSDLSDLGVRRVFAYIAVPHANGAPGLVCVHGGGGHAYAEYALEAAMHGYAAIAIDTEGYHNTTGGSTPYNASAHAPDSLGHCEKDNFANAEKSLSEQWLYYAVMDTVIANTVLRSMSEVDENAVGITGISWGGLITSTALCYDHRYAFAAPIYISFHMAESYGISVGGLPSKPFAAALWQDEALFKQCPVPTLIISCENDLFASVDTVSKSANDLPNGTLLIKPGLLHGQQFGASLPEIYHFGDTVLGKADGFITPKAEPSATTGKHYTLALDIPEGAENVTARLYYRSAPLRSYTDRKQIVFDEIELAVNDDGTVNVDLPEDTKLYYISFSYYDKAVDEKQTGTPYLGSYLNGCEIEGRSYERGYIYSSTDLIVLP